MIEIRPDPAHPRGGFAQLSVDGASVTGDEVSLTILNTYNQQYLGESGWQATKAYFGPYPVQIYGETARLIVGPEIVNRIADDTPMRIAIGDASFDTWWPDDVNQNPEAAVIGGVSATPMKGGARPANALVGKLPEADADGADTGAAKSEPVEAQHTAVIPGGASSLDEPSEVRSSNAGLYAGLGLLILAAAAAGAWFLLLAPEPEPIADPEPTDEMTEAAPVVADASECGADSLSAAGESGFAALTGRLRDCGADVSVDDALLLIENRVAQGDAEALSFFGSLYDETVTDDVIEQTIGLTFPDNPARAAEYYARASEGGSGDASERLVAVCRRLFLMSDTLSQSAHEDYCNQ